MRLLAILLLVGSAVPATAADGPAGPVITAQRLSTPPRIEVDIINTKTTYQFTRELFLRGIAQYDSSRHRILTDTLLSYELRPGSVTYLGYGSLIEQRGYRDDGWVLGEGRLRESQRGFFAKVSYLLRL